jgi:Peptidase M66
VFSLRGTLANRQANHQLPPGYNIGMGIVVLCGRPPVSITRLRDSPCPESVIVHFKSLLAINNNINQFIDTQFIAMQRLFAEGDVAVLRGTTEDLSGNMALQPLQSLDVGQCQGTLTAEQTTLFTNRNNVGNNELVVYIVANLIDASGAAGNFLGCATHPNGQPGAAVVQSNARWLVAHEVGHVLGLGHVSGQSDRLMFPNVGWTNVPPDLTAAENSTMQNSSLTRPC